MFVLDIDNQELLLLSDNILNIFKEAILINNNNKDISTIYYKNDNHFTICFQEISQNVENNKLKNNILYYHDGLENKGIIQELKIINELYELKNVFLYLFIYEKQ